MKHEKTPGKGLSGKLVALLLALTLVIGCVAGGTVAWLTAKTKPVVNTFTFGNINITLEESKGTADDVINQNNRSFKAIPGCTIEKDPTITVLKNSEKCYLFVKVEEANNQDKIVEYTVDVGDSAWTKLDDESNVYYRVVENSTADQKFNVLKENKVTISTELTKEKVEAMEKAETLPTLTFTAYAVQQDGIENVADAWAKISPATPTP